MRPVGSAPACASGLIATLTATGSRAAAPMERREWFAARVRPAHHRASLPRSHERGPGPAVGGAPATGARFLE